MRDEQLEGLSIHLDGTVGEVGKVTFLYQGRDVDSTTLPELEFAAHSLLAMATHCTQKHRSAKELAKELGQWQIIATQGTVIKTVYRHRNRLKKLKLATFLTEQGLIKNPDDIGMSLIQHHRLLGYKLGVSDVTMDFLPAQGMLPDLGVATAWSAVGNVATY